MDYKIKYLKYKKKYLHLKKIQIGAASITLSQPKNSNIDLSYPSMSSLGYDEIYRYLNGEVSLNDATQKIKINTHRFIRSQYNWFRISDMRIHWFDTAQSEYSYQDKVKSLLAPFCIHN